MHAGESWILEQHVGGHLGNLPSIGRLRDARCHRSVWRLLREMLLEATTTALRKCIIRTIVHSAAFHHLTLRQGHMPSSS